MKKVTISYHKFKNLPHGVKNELSHFDIFFEPDNEISNLITYEFREKDWIRLQDGEKIDCKKKKITEEFIWISKDPFPTTEAMFKLYGKEHTMKNLFQIRKKFE